MCEDLGVAGTIAVKVFSEEFKINNWLESNPDLEVIDIRMNANVALIIYRKELVKGGNPIRA